MQRQYPQIVEINGRPMTPECRIDFEAGLSGELLLPRGYFIRPADIEKLVEILLDENAEDSGEGPIIYFDCENPYMTLGTLS
jgi:hypothetical protein